MDNVKNAIESLKSGKVGIFPTDTAFGIGCRMDDEKTVKRVYALRNRPAEKALLVLVSSIEMAERYVEIPENVKKKLIDRYWPGGLTIILKSKKEKVLQIVSAGGGTLAVRFPNNKVLCSIIDEVGVPIVAPSANLSGRPTPLKLSEVDKNLKQNIWNF